MPQSAGLQRGLTPVYPVAEESMQYKKLRVWSGTRSVERLLTLAR